MFFYCCLEISTQLLSNTIKYICSFRGSTIWFGQVGYQCHLPHRGKWSEKISVKSETVNNKFRYQKYNYKFETNIHVPVNPIQYVEFFNISATRTASF